MTVNVKDFGAVGDGSNHDSAAIQQAVNSITGYGRVYFPDGVYYINDTILISSNIVLYGEGTLLSKRNNPALDVETSSGVIENKVTFYPTTIFKNSDFISGNQHIVIEGLKFDGNWINGNPGQSYGTDDIYNANLLRFENVTELVIKDCDIFNNSSNWGGDLGNFGAVAIVDCDTVRFENIRFKDSRVEGIEFIRSNNINIRNLFTENVSVWTPLHAWYCDNITVRDSIILETITQTGSTINFAVKNCLIENCKFIGGAGLDFGDEAAAEPGFQIENITVTNCIIQTNYDGIYTDSAVLKNFTFTHNNVSVKLRGVSLYNSENIYIGHNNISLNNQANSYGIYLANNIINLTIQNNLIDADCGIIARVQQANDQVSDVIIGGNIINCYSLNGESSYQANSAGIYLRKYDSNTGTAFKNWTIKNNKIDSEGSWIYTPNPADVQTNFDVQGNMFLSTSLGCERGLTLSHITNLNISNNRLYDCQKNYFGSNSTIFVLNNIIDYDLHTPNNNGLGFTIENNSGVGVFEYNYMFNNTGTKGILYTHPNSPNTFILGFGTFNRNYPMG